MNKLSRRQIKLIAFYRGFLTENKVRHFMQTDSNLHEQIVSNLHEISTLIFSEKKTTTTKNKKKQETYFKISPAEIFTQHAK